MSTTLANGKIEVPVCAYCQGINMPQFTDMAKNVSPEVKKEMAVVDQQIRAADRNKYHFTHGTCPVHYEYQLRTIPGMNDERVKQMMSKGNNRNPCLLTNDALRHGFMRGLFTPEEIQAAEQQVQQSNHALVERFQALSGIKSVYGDQK